MNISHNWNQKFRVIGQKAPWGLRRSGWRSWNTARSYGFCFSLFFFSPLQSRPLQSLPLSSPPLPVLTSPFLFLCPLSSPSPYSLTALCFMSCHGLNLKCPPKLSFAFGGGWIWGTVLTGVLIDWWVQDWVCCWEEDPGRTGGPLWSDPEGYILIPSCSFLSAYWSPIVWEVSLLVPSIVTFSSDSLLWTGTFERVSQNKSLLL